MIYGIGDLHFDFSKNKPMDIFGDNWIDHEEQIINNWKDKVNDEDLVLIPGDISWALRHNEAYFDLKRIHELPGKKVLIKGNHDYWWQSLNKLKAMELDSIEYIQNTAFQYKDYIISGTRGWYSKDSDNFTEDDEKVFRRELMRLRMSLSHIENQDKKRIVMLHYPPFNMDFSPNEFVFIMKEFGVDICIYGHLHSDGHKFAVEGNIEGIEFRCVSSDYINFSPKEL
ncbi:MAG: serine/threonine protein phosphatase [Tissierella sp.]|nr:serine/threonine protein phosphatase [Tissierella sp.]